jgi:hypothetical protein
MKVLFDCQQVSRLISEGLDQKLSAPERARMRLHFVICQHCRTVDEQMKFLSRAMKQLGRDDEGAPRVPDASDRSDLRGRQGKD